MSHIAILGQTPKLSFLELETVFSRLGITQPIQTHTNIATLSDISPAIAKTLQTTLGGTVKIASLLGIGQQLDSITPAATEYLAHSEGKIAFALSSFDASVSLNQIGKSIKQSLTQIGRQSRFRLLDSPHTSSGILKDYQEIIILKQAQSLSIYSTITVQDINRWKQKDFDRPVADPKSGMMPPKICRILLNLSLTDHIDANTTSYDPFCGSGTMLMEALDLGISTIGSDISQNAIAISHQNLDWFTSLFKPNGKYRIFQADVHHLDQIDSLTNLDSIVFEGYLGPPHLKPRQIPNQIKGLNKLYTGALKQLLPLLKPGCRLVCALPEYHHQGSVKNLDSLIDTCEKFGYTQQAEPITYSREKAKVARRIYILQKNAS